MKEFRTTCANVAAMAMECGETGEPFQEATAGHEVEYRIVSVSKTADGWKIIGDPSLP